MKVNPRNKPKMVVVYKAVNHAVINFEGDVVYFSITARLGIASVGSVWGVNYKINSVSRPPFPHSPIMAFDTIENAFEEYSSHVMLLRCHAVLFPRTHPVWRLYRLVAPTQFEYTRQNFVQFWRMVNEGHTEGAFDLPFITPQLGLSKNTISIPTGTLFCKQVTPVSVVSIEETLSVIRSINDKRFRWP